MKVEEVRVLLEQLASAAATGGVCDRGERALLEHPSFGPSP
ncbi:hypothetical protein ACICHK_39040 [Streptomyces sp. AHU1]